jgi:ferredoxin
MKTTTKLVLLSIVAFIFCLGMTSCADYDNNLVDLRDHDEPTFIQNKEQAQTNQDNEDEGIL